jgi:hypothetical protein
MAQYDFGTIDPNTKSGTALATDLNSYRNAVNSMHSGSSAPSYITAGMMWVDTTSANYEVKLYDGAQSITVAIIDATNNVARVAVDPAETSYITATTSAQIRHVIASTNIFTTRSTGIQFNLASPVIADSNNNELISFTTTASAVNQLNIANSATGGAVNLSAVGTDTNISIALTPKGTGGVGIGTTSPATALDVVGQASFGDGTAAAPSITNTGDLDTGIFFPSANNIALSTAGSERLKVDSAGTVFFCGSSTLGVFDGIGVNVEATGAVSVNVTDPVAPLDINNSVNDNIARSMIRFFRREILNGSITTSSTATAYVTASDYRLKENVQPMTGALNLVAQLNPVTYTWKTDGSDGQGFIAHELQAVVPDCVIGEKDAVDADGKPEYQGVDTSFLVATLTAAIQEQQAIIAALEARLTALEAQ